MIITRAAQERLSVLANRSKPPITGFRLRDYIGSCRGSTPLLKPARHGAEGDREVKCGAVSLFIPEQFHVIAEGATLDYDGSFLGPGLFLTWAHREGCECSRGR